MMDFPIVSQIIIDFASDIYTTATQPYHWISSFFQNVNPSIKSNESPALSTRKVSTSEFVLTEEENQLINSFNSVVTAHSLVMAAFIELYRTLNDERIPEVLKECFSTKKDRIDAIFNMFIMGWVSEWMKTRSILCEYGADFKPIFINEEQWIESLKSETETLSLRNRTYEEYYPVLDRVTMLLNLIVKLIKNKRKMPFINRKNKTDEELNYETVLRELNELMAFLVNCYERIPSISNGVFLTLNDFIVLDDVKSLQTQLSNLQNKIGKKNFCKKVDQWVHHFLLTMQKKAKNILQDLFQETKLLRRDSCSAPRIKEQCAGRALYRLLFKSVLISIAIELDECKGDRVERISIARKFLLQGTSYLFEHESVKQVEQEENIDSSYRDIILFVRNNLTNLSEQLQKQIEPFAEEILEINHYEDCLLIEDKLEKAINISRDAILKLTSIKKKVLKQLDVFFRSIKKENLKQDKETWITYFKETMLKESADFIPAVMFVKEYVNYYKNYKVHVPFQNFDPIIDDFLKLEGIESIIDNILHEAIVVELSPTLKIAVRSPKAKTQTIPIELLELQKSSTYNSEMIIDVPLMVAKPEHRRWKENGASSSNSQGVVDLVDEMDTDDKDEDFFVRGQKIRHVEMELKSHGLDVVDTGRRTGSHSKQVQGEGINPFTLSVHPGRDIGPRTARDLNEIMREVRLKIRSKARS